MRLTALIAPIVAAGIVCTVAIPHHHGRHDGSSHTQTCRVCRIQQTVAATPAASTALQASLPLIVQRVLIPATSRRSTSVPRFASPRAPPILL